jgi:serum/glucocorticoid-regulated kinase 2
MENISIFDLLDYSKDESIKKNITLGEKIYYSDKIEKINKKGTKQSRIIIITEKAIYNMKKKKLKRRIPLEIIKGITTSTLNDYFIIHCSNDEYDYYYCSIKKRTIFEILSKVYSKLTGEELNLFQIPEESIWKYVTLKQDKKKDPNISKMPETGGINVLDSIYKNSNINFNNNSFISINNSNPNKRNSLKKANKISIQNFDNNVNLLNFNILKVIGRGNYAKIYLVTNKKNGDFYALKSIRKDQIISENILHNILCEKEILSNNDCEFLLKSKFFFQSPERIYFVTPFIRGGDLFHLLKKKGGHLNEDLIRFYCAQIAIAIQEIHDCEYIYRDLKPENILIDEDGFIKLCDFGACTRINKNKKSKEFVGNIYYASPEMISGNGYDIMTDWWSFGILIYELLTGIVPFDSPDKKRTSELIVLSALKFPKELYTENGEKVPFCPSKDIKNLIEKLLIKDPHKRLGRKNGIEEIKTHSFFRGLKFDLIQTKKLKVIYKPNLSKDKCDTSSNFDEFFTKMDIKESPVDNWINKYQSDFDKFLIDTDE